MRVLVMVVLVLFALPAVALAAGDNGKIAFTSKQDGPAEDIWVVNANGTRSNDSTRPETEPAWRSAGSAIVWTSSRAGHPEIYTMRPDGTGQRRLVPGTSKDEYPAPSPDGRKLAFRRSAGSVDIWIAN